MTDEKILEALARCQCCLPTAEVRRALPTEIPSREGMWRHLGWMMDETRVLVKDGRREKAMRWLGFIQGVIWATGMATIDDLKAMNKPDTESGTDT